VDEEADVVTGEATHEPDELLGSSIGRDDVGDSHVVVPAP
jgi:hypothetical protein